jgi:hypothetical protein
VSLLLATRRWVAVGAFWRLLCSSRKVRSIACIETCSQMSSPRTSHSDCEAGSTCIGLVAKTESEKNMVKIKILDWALLLQEFTKKKHAPALFPMAASSFSSPENLLSNYCIISNNGFVIIRFHWNNIVWDISLEKDVMLASALIMNCIWHNC